MNTIPTLPTVAEAVARLTDRNAAGALPADEADDIRVLLAYVDLVGRTLTPDPNTHAGRRSAAVVAAFEVGYKIGSDDAHREA